MISDRKEYNKEYRQRPYAKLKNRTYTKAYEQRQDIKDKKKIYNQLPETKLRRAEYYKKLRLKALQTLSGSLIPKCSQCGINDIDVLNIDHIIYCGSANREKVYPTFLKKIIDNPIESRKKYQVLCANCNLKKQKQLRERRKKDVFKNECT